MTMKVKIEAVSKENCEKVKAAETSRRRRSAEEFNAATFMKSAQAEFKKMVQKAGGDDVDVKLTNVSYWNNNNNDGNNNDGHNNNNNNNNGHNSNNNNGQNSNNNNNNNNNVLLSCLS